METEKCIMCSVDTGIAVDTHIDTREYYVEGAGQLCEKCWLETYKQATRCSSEVNKKRASYRGAFPALYPLQIGTTELQRSPVTRLVRDQEIVGSNPANSTQ